MYIPMSLPVIAGGRYTTDEQFSYIDRIRIAGITVNGLSINNADMTYRESGTPGLYHLEIFKSNDVHLGGMLQVNRSTGVIETFIMSDKFIDDIVVTLELDSKRG